MKIYILENKKCLENKKELMQKYSNKRIYILIYNFQTNSSLIWLEI